MKKNFERNINLVKNSLIIAVGTIFTRLINFIMIPFYTQWLSPSEYGNFDLVSTFVFLGVSISTFQLDQALYRYTLEDTNRGKEYFKIIIKFLSPIIIILSLIMIIITGIFKFPKYIYIGILYYVAICTYTICIEYIRGLKKLKIYSFINIVLGILLVTLNIIFVKIYSLSTLGMILSFALSYAFISIGTLLYLKPFTKIDKTKSEKKIHQLLSYSIPLIPNSLAWWITNISDRLIIVFFWGNYLNGIYAIANKIPTILTILYGIFNLSFQQTAVESINDPSNKMYFNGLFSSIIKLIFSLSFIVVTGTPLFYLIFINEKYYSGLSSVYILLASVVFLSIGQFLGSILLAKKQTRIIGTSTMMSSFLNFLLNFMLIPRYGIVAAACTTLFSYMIMMVSRLRKLESIIDLRRSSKLIGIFSVIYVLFTFIIIKSGFNILFNVISFFSAVFLFIYINREMLVVLIRSILIKMNWGGQ